jgi:hypothetical protein
MPASTRSGNPAKRAPARKAPVKRAAARPVGPSSAADFKRGSQGELIELPSGNSAEIRRIPLPTLIAEGLLGDSISLYAQQAVEAGKGMESEDIQDLAKDPKKLQEAFAAYDKVAVRCFVTPKVLSPTDADGRIIPESERYPDALYADELDLEDKVFVFQVVAGGTADLERFREEFAQSVAGVSDSSGVQVPSE